MRNIHRVALGATSSLISLGLLGLTPGLAIAATHQVGPNRAIQELAELTESLQPGDVVELDGNASYVGDVWMESYGTADAPVTIRGVTIAGKRPVIVGGDYTLMLKGGHYLVENVEITGGSEVCLFQKGEGLVMRDSLVRDCPKHGILGADWDTGSVLLSRVEVTGCGFEVYKHQVYIATDETNHPGSVFRMEGCWIHDSTGGMNVKSRAERVELYGNWIEGSSSHEIDLVGSQEHPVDMVREDSDVVGNVFVKAPGNIFSVARVGGDGTGNTRGRHRFVNNTVILSDATGHAFRLAGELESFEFHGNVVYGNGPTQLWREEYPGTMVVSGSSNWISQSVTLPDGRISGLRGTDPGFADLAGHDFHPGAGSPLLDAATPWPASPPGLEFPDAMGIPEYLPFVPGGQDFQVRHEVGGLDVGAFELGGESAGGGGEGGEGPGATGTTVASTGVGTGAGGGGSAGSGGGDEGGASAGEGGAGSEVGTTTNTTGSAGEGGADSTGGDGGGRASTTGSSGGDDDSTSGPGPDRGDLEGTFGGCTTGSGGSRAGSPMVALAALAAAVLHGRRRRGDVKPRSTSTS